MDSEQALRELRAEYQARRETIVNPDRIDPIQIDAAARAFRRHQVGAHERVARRRARDAGVPLDGGVAPAAFYRGPEATDDERREAYDELATLNPYWRRL